MAYEGGGFDEWDGVISILAIESRFSEDILRAAVLVC